MHTELMTNTEKSRLFMLGGLFAVAWIAVHAYLGIWHDGSLYLGQALLQLYPDVYQNDLFFKYGSQDQFTIFSSIYAWMIQQFGLEVGSQALMIISQCLFALSLVLCCTRIFGREVGLWAAISVALISHAYGGRNVFSYAEVFVTARSFAEPLCLFAIWLLLGRHAVLAFLVLIFAALFHPLVALPCMLLWWIYMSAQNRKWLWLAAGGVLMPIMGMLGIQPFDKILQTYDESWWNSVREVNPQVIPLQWRLSNWALLGCDVVLIWFGSRFMHKELRDFLRMVLLTAMICMVISVIGTSALQNVFLTGIQIWRGHWILHLFAVSSIPYLIYKLWPLGGIARFSALFVIMAGYLLPYSAALGMVLLAAWFYHYHKRGGNFSRELQWILWGALGLIVAIKTGTKVAAVFKEADPIFAYLMVKTWQEKLQQIVTAFPVTWIFAGIIGWLIYRPKYRIAACVGLTLALVVSAGMWDQRKPWQKYIEQEHAEPHPFQQYLTGRGEVFWYGDLLAPWVLLKTPSFFETSQGSGLLFNQNTRKVFAERKEALDVLHFQTSICEITDYLNQTKDCQPSFEVVQEACAISPTLEAMILPWKVMGMNYKAWSIHLPGSERETNFYLYQCEPFRTNASS